MRVPLSVFSLQRDALSVNVQQWNVSLNCCSIVLMRRVFSFDVKINGQRVSYVESRGPTTCKDSDFDIHSSPPSFTCFLLLLFLFYSVQASVSREKGVSSLVEIVTEGVIRA